MNFAVLAYSYSVGNVLLDQSVPLEGTEARMHAITPAFARSINIFGLSGRISAALPMATATWNAELDGVDTSTTRNGLADPVVGLAVNFIGVPALKGKEFITYKQNTTLGASVKVRVPIGQYNSEKFFNLSTGRWCVNARVGFAQRISRFVLEAYLSAWFFTTNNNFFGGNRVAQDPLYAAQLHLTYVWSPGFWTAISFGQSYGGATTVNDEPKDSIQRNNRFGLTMSLPISTQFALKLAYAKGISTRFGANLESLVAAVQYRWGG
ncbi:MAG: transporter [Bacteroidota bacterium]